MAVYGSIRSIRPSYLWHSVSQTTVPSPDSTKGPSGLADLWRRHRVPNLLRLITAPTSGHLRPDLPPEFIHPPYRPRQPGLRRAEHVLLIPQATNKNPRLHANQWFRTQAGHDRPDVQTVHLGEPPRPQPVIRVVTGSVVPSAQWARRQVRGLLTDPVRSRVCGLNLACRSAHGTGKGTDPSQVSEIADWFHPQLLRNECRPVTRAAPGTFAPLSIATLSMRLSTLTSGLFTCLKTAVRCSMSSPSSSRSHVTAGDG